MRGKSLCLSLCVLCASPSGAEAAISVRGLSNKKVYADQVTFTVEEAAGYTITAALNGAAVPVGTPFTVTDPEYYELSVEALRQSDGTRETELFQFIVRASERGNSEWGLPPFVPYPLVPSAASEFSGAHLTLIVPSSYCPHLPLPLVALVEDGEGRRVGVNGILTASELPQLSLRIIRGVGSTLLSPPPTGLLQLTCSVGPLSGEVTIPVEDGSFEAVSGTLASSTDWGNNARIEVTGHLTVPSGVTLSVGEGSIVALHSGVEVRVDGVIQVSGTPQRPVYFVPEVPESPWGGFVLKASSSRGAFRGAVITGSGADPDWFERNSGVGHSHRHEQCAFYLGQGAEAVFDDCYVVWNAGQAGHGESASLTMNRCLIQGCITAGQYNGGSVRLASCALIEFPRYDAPFEDRDNDGLYLTRGNHRLVDCLIGFALDDGIDAGSGGGGSVEVTDCWIEACYHEGMAWSGGDSGSPRRPTVTDTVVLNCGQGIECGFDYPMVEARHIFATANAVGARFGDNYDWSYHGFLRVTDSLLLYNRRNIWGRNWDDWTERLSQMDLHDNYLSEEDPLHPDNTLWDPSTNTAALIPFLPVLEGEVGVGIAVPFGATDDELLRSGVPVRLSSFCTVPVSVAYTVDSEGGNLTSGTLTFVPGETVKRIEVGDLAGGEHAVVRISLSDPVNAELTGEDTLIVRRPVTLVARGSVWRYSDGGVDQGQAWRLPGFEASSWQQGRAELGYGDGDEATVINGGPSGNRYPTVYFLKTFTVQNPRSFERLLLELKRDDGAVVYLNGEEVLRSNMLEGPVFYNTWAAGTTSDEDSYRSAEVSADYLVAGENVIAVEVHQAGPNSSDVSFDCALIGIPALAPPGGFVRGDSNGDTELNISDAVWILLVLFAHETSDCPDAVDTDDSGDLNIADAIYLLSYLFAGGPSPPPPFPVPGEDPTADELSCDRK